MPVIKGVELRHQRVFADERGELTAFERDRDLPFPLERVFTIEIDKGGIVRGGHANSCDELIVCLAGSVTVQVNNGMEWQAISLGSPAESLWVRPGVIIHLRDFSPKTVLLVFASALYEETIHYDEPQPALFMADCVP